jgi:hypothetical protein
MWYQKFDTNILSLGFVRGKSYHHIYSKEEHGHCIYATLYFEDMLLIGNDMDAIKEVRKIPSSKLDMKDLDATSFIMGIDIKRDQAARNLWFNQTNYIETIMKHFNMQDCKMVKVPIHVVPDLTHTSLVWDL